MESETFTIEDHKRTFLEFIESEVIFS